MLENPGRLKFIVIFMMIVLMLVVSACGGEDATEKEGRVNQSTTVPKEGTESLTTNTDAIPPKPVELTIFSDTSLSGLGFDGTHDGFMETYGNFIQAKHPHFSFKLIFSAAGGEKLDSLIASKTKFDMRLAAVGMLRSNETLELAYDLTELTKKYQFDLNRIIPTGLDWVYANGNGKLGALPVTMNSSSLFYNRDLFEKFANTPPTDDLTWDETIQLARKMPRLDDGRQYLGFASFVSWSNHFLRNQLSQDYIDQNNRAVYESGLWKRLFEQFLPFYQIDGGEYIFSGKAMEAFVKEERLAMLIGNYDIFAQFPEEMNWDAASLPSFKEHPGVNDAGTYFYWAVTTLSEHPEEAFLAISELLSDEVQLRLARSGKSPVLANRQIREQYGADLPVLQGKNIKALQPETLAPPIMLGPYTLSILGDLNTAFTAVVNNEKDINTALRDAAEASNKRIEEIIVAEGSVK